MVPWITTIQYYYKIKKNIVILLVKALSCRLDPSSSRIIIALFFPFSQSTLDEQRSWRLRILKYLVLALGPFLARISPLSGLAILISRAKCLYQAFAITDNKLPSLPTLPLAVCMGILGIHQKGKT
ncbi:hypothetical protein FCM35_KLT04475 [Carex littledalei]|uniref:Uncharacterized protein n=1 Tax=Carex littledalei TaxID=544730 RepID=A0A833VAM7_9POAL|nr:hypothetical protein FCM35_KLT04475 [Carex littledalei]